MNLWKDQIITWFSLNMTLKEIVAENYEFENLQYRFASVIARQEEEQKKLIEQGIKKVGMISKDAVKHIKGKDDEIIINKDRTERYEILVKEVENLER